MNEKELKKFIEAHVNAVLKEQNIEAKVKAILKELTEKK